ncbi:uncharacterized protein OCT59_025605 [Rhizophagus irregularis]|uniref:Uncharacterized protein n=2 Tax=Rhizophagus irregularis TaxID=588596 RepID=A0A015I573_RHIIW|nr:hypothetical protein GLOIN_2v1493921 [Rhizophagus irregularis DAOM 181602=DAOM 197198]EXX52157.1 hypothetical protein RirG_255470 [Rhizophagus irregularis DAOM 197198w]UZO05246.1 hypothetical protein OCT59_025605 [Rhizophagus irregularis]POG82805.1 hypothetical protein GLOIN_2v1493921 [Rhizophagus irregularis DAOM 181602=DAOM 197198]CAG8661513.1 2352_t:CDS:1 [Rhizophagus irregularis]GBC11254.1 hypothetical protein GLOIN_2v1493921 [Rhizophagus irregularis DAOM 181602=DAOM 197198]|eukprot:XP_025189671.1 hypothetical protein GLOIN_2v1493921 [Rhizophagus irregularis DAOM 181602=DAOM 197198]
MGESSIQVKTSFPPNDFNSESPKQNQTLQSPLSYSPREDNCLSPTSNKRLSYSPQEDNCLSPTSIKRLSYSPREDNGSSPTSNKRPTISTIFSFYRSSPRVKPHRSETYQGKDEYTNGCFGYLRTSGSKLKYKVTNVWKFVKINCKKRFSKNKNYL